MNKLKSLLISLLALLFITSCEKGAFDYNKGLLFLKFKDYSVAEQSFVDALVKNPNLGISRYALALSFLPREQLKDSLVEIDSLLKKNKSDESRFKLFFAKAVIYTLLGEIDPTLDYYQKCLYLKPDSIEVKTNIELLFSGGDGDGKGKSLKSMMSKKKKKQKSDSGEKTEQSEDDPKAQNEAEKQNQKESQKKKNLSAQDVERILKELKQQEKKVRSKGYQGQQGDGKQKSSKGKPW